MWVGVGLAILGCVSMLLSFQQPNALSYEAICVYVGVGVLIAGRIIIRTAKLMNELHGIRGMLKGGKRDIGNHEMTGANGNHPSGDRESAR